MEPEKIPVVYRIVCKMSDTVQGSPFPFARLIRQANELGDVGQDRDSSHVIIIRPHTDGGTTRVYAIHPIVVLGKWRKPLLGPALGTHEKAKVLRCGFYIEVRPLNNVFSQPFFYLIDNLMGPRDQRDQNTFGRFQKQAG